MASAWYGNLQGSEQYAQNTTLRASLSLAMDYWFARDFPGTTCLDAGGTPACPCSNPNNYLWWVVLYQYAPHFTVHLITYLIRNTNWYSNVGFHLLTLECPPQMKEMKLGYSHPRPRWANFSAPRGHPHLRPGAAHYPHDDAFVRVQC